MEIERKFRIRQCPLNLDAYTSLQLSQGYISTEPVIRIRCQNQAYRLTIKGEGHMVREEFELPLTQAAYSNLKQKVSHPMIEKTRYLIPEDQDLVIELDVFHGHLDGLILAEVEFTSVESANAYQPPAWFDEECTYDPRFSNASLCQVDHIPKT